VLVMRSGGGPAFSAVEAASREAAAEGGGGVGRSTAAGAGLRGKGASRNAPEFHNVTLVTVTTATVAKAETWGQRMRATPRGTAARAGVGV
jgi:hypothetical protein